MIVPPLAVVARGTISPSLTVSSLSVRSLSPKNGLDVQYREAECFKIDAENKKVYCISKDAILGGKEEFTVDYDYLVVAMGARPNTFNTLVVVENAFFLKIGNSNNDELHLCRDIRYKQCQDLRSRITLY